MIAMNQPTCRHLLEAFFKRYPNDLLYGAAPRALIRLVDRRIPLPGKPAGWGLE